MHALILLRATLSPLDCMVVHGSGGGTGGGCTGGRRPCSTSTGTYAGAAFCNSYCVVVSVVVVAHGRWWWYILYVLYCTCYLCQEYMVYIYRCMHSTYCMYATLFMYAIIAELLIK